MFLDIVTVYRTFYAPSTTLFGYPTKKYGLGDALAIRASLQPKPEQRMRLLPPCWLMHIFEAHTYPQSLFASREFNLVTPPVVAVDSRISIRQHLTVASLRSRGRPA